MFLITNTSYYHFKWNRLYIETLEEAIYKNTPAIDVYRQEIVQFLKQEVLKQTATFPYNLHRFIEQQPEVTATSDTCPLCNATFKGEQVIIIFIFSPKVALHKRHVTSGCCSINPCKL